MAAIVNRVTALVPKVALRKFTFDRPCGSLTIFSFQPWRAMDNRNCPVFGILLALNYVHQCQANSVKFKKVFNKLLNQLPPVLGAN